MGIGRLQRLRARAQHHLRETGERMFASRFIVRAYALYTVLGYLYYRFLRSSLYDAVSVTLHYEKILSLYPQHPLNRWIVSTNRHVLEGCRRDAANTLRSSFRSSKRAGGYRKEFRSYGLAYATRLKYPRSNDVPERQGNLIVLKPYVDEREKGALGIEFNDGLEKFLALYEVAELSRRYRLVLEPSTWGYRDPIFYCFVGLPTDVIVQAQSESDFEVIDKLQSNLHPIRIGAGDWVDPRTFDYVDGTPKEYDLIMVAAWLKLKRHRLLLEALSRIKDRSLKVALVGYPSRDSTMADIKAQAAELGITAHRIDYFERIPHRKVSELIQKSRVGVMLSKREGANKGIYECLFCNVPVIMTSKNVGVNRLHINQETGLLADDETLQDTIVEALDHLSQFSPRRWALENTGCFNSAAKLNAFLQQLARRRGEAWTKDIFLKKNAPYLTYVEDEDRIAGERELDNIARFLHPEVAVPPAAVR